MVRATLAIASVALAAVLWRAGAPAPSPAVPLTPPAPAAGGGTAASAPPALPAPVPPRSAAPTASTTPAVASVEAAVRNARRHGKGEQEVHRLRSARLPAEQVEALARMEAAEANWQQRLEALQAACAANIGCDDARASFTREELARTTAYAAPTLRQ
ncbi:MULTISPECIES: lipase secretion chaperone [unclassified Duganella]|uniref:lipase secretion chaperone n=1 Tax=unclassified Duganella TaxID=2636909 RepID=UPI0006F7C324|nr:MULTISPECIES: lipase secretion chaperone [unclassified Duganella]KQV46027.1 hypothetical protein ASD07_16205 [Duganella sp. Root336D2]KRB81693.1 hypothetical protein ASE26_15250 [Duganella sp. Root198D2]